MVFLQRYFAEKFAGNIAEMEYEERNGAKMDKKKETWRSTMSLIGIYLVFFFFPSPIFASIIAANPPSNKEQPIAIKYSTCPIISIPPVLQYTILQSKRLCKMDK